MLDVVEIALDSITDFLDFEKLACEIMQEEGYPDIQPLGGATDFGQDAQVERLYESTGRRTRLVFQITTQETVEAKLRDTVRRLDEADVQYTSLVLVTNQRLTTERQRKLEVIARELEIELRVYERKTLVTRLSRLENGMFIRHFPDVDRQLRLIQSSEATAPFEDEDLVRTAMAFAASREADRARLSVFRELSLALLVHSEGGSASVQELVELHSDRLPGADSLVAEQLRAALDRWVGVGFVERLPGGRYRPTPEGSERAVAAELEVAFSISGLASDVADVVETASGSPLDSTIRRLVERNARACLSLMFRLLGLELSSQLLADSAKRQAQLGSYERIVEQAGDQLASGMSAVVVAAIGELLAGPNPEQAAALKALALGYVGASLIQGDPAVRELTATSFRGKTFVLDTDFLLECIVDDQPRAGASRSLVESLVDTGARVVVPAVCVAEAVDHASIAMRTVNFFGGGLFALSPELAMERINNVFAKGWYFRSLSVSVDFMTYLSNYYEPDDAQQFMDEVIRNVLPGVVVGELDELLGVSLDTERVDDLAQVLRPSIAASRKSLYRTDDETTELARTDAQLYVTTKAAAGESPQAGSALAGSCYLVTSSNRFIRAAERAFGSPDTISARPDTLTALMTVIGRSDLDAREFMSLFSNPLLQQAVAASGEDILRLLDAGISLKDKGLARLRWDLDHGIHARIAAVTAAELAADAAGTDESLATVDEAIIDLVDEARNREFTPQPQAQPLLKEIAALRSDRDRLEGELSDLTERHEALAAEIELFGRRKQRYLRRVARGQPRPGGG